MGFWKSLFGDPELPPTTKPGCPHNLIRAHTTSIRGKVGRVVICTCLDCGESLEFALGIVVESMLATVTADVLKASGYQKDPADGSVWMRGARE